MARLLPACRDQLHGRVRLHAVPRPWIRTGFAGRPLLILMPLVSRHPLAPCLQSVGASVVGQPPSPPPAGEGEALVTPGVLPRCRGIRPAATFPSQAPPGCPDLAARHTVRRGPSPVHLVLRPRRGDERPHPATVLGWDTPMAWLWGPVPEYRCGSPGRGANHRSLHSPTPSGGAALRSRQASTGCTQTHLPSHIVPSMT